MRSTPISPVAQFGTAVTPQLVAGTMQLIAPLHRESASELVTVHRDERYGSHARHRLDIFQPKVVGDELRPVLVYVHGGGFVGGDKTAQVRPFYDNVGYWAVKHGMIGVTITYRLAPEFRWPAGSEDVAAAVEWVRNHIRAYGGDADNLIVMGQSAGAVHVAGYLARQRAQLPAAAILVSGLYDVHTMERNPLFDAYFGLADAPESAAFLDALVGSGIPLMVAVAELDPPDFLRQALLLLQSYFERHGTLPRFWQAAGENHLSTVLRLNTAHDGTGSALLEFIAAVTERPASSG